MLDDDDGGICGGLCAEGGVAREGRIWPKAFRDSVVAESFRPGALVREVADRHGVRRQTLTRWRKEARQAGAQEPAASSFAFVAIDEERPPSLACPADMLEIEFAGVTVRLPLSSSALRVAELASALRSAP